VSVTRIIQGKELIDVLAPMMKGIHIYGTRSDTRQYLISYDEQNRDEGFHLSWKMLMPNGTIQKTTNHVKKMFSSLEEAVGYINDHIEGPFA